MTKKIYKYELEITDTQEIQMPAAAELLSVHEQRGKICVWAVVDPDQEEDGRIFSILGTGNPFDGELIKDMVFLGTVVEAARPFVWHVFANQL